MKKIITSVIALLALTIEVPLTEFATELVRTGYCTNPVLVSIRTRGEGH